MLLSVILRCAILLRIILRCELCYYQKYHFDQIYSVQCHSVHYILLRVILLHVTGQNNLTQILLNGIFLSLVLLNVMVPTCLFQKLKYLSVCLIAFTIALNKIRGASDYATFYHLSKGLLGTNTPAYSDFVD
jgi:hypothetical protein